MVETKKVGVTMSGLFGDERIRLLTCNHVDARSPCYIPATHKHTAALPCVTGDDLVSWSVSEKSQTGCGTGLCKRMMGNDLSGEPSTLDTAGGGSEKRNQRMTDGKKGVRVYVLCVDNGSGWDTGKRNIPLRLKRRVKVLPQPGTGHMKCASLRRLLALAACVADVVTCCFSTWRMGGRRGGAAPLAN